MFSFLSKTYLGVEFLDHKAYLCLLRLPSNFPKCLCHFTSPTGVSESSRGSTAWPTLDVVTRLYFSHSDRGMEEALGVVLHSC